MLLLFIRLWGFVLFWWFWLIGLFIRLTRLIYFLFLWLLWFMLFLFLFILLLFLFLFLILSVLLFVLLQVFWSRWLMNGLIVGFFFEISLNNMLTTNTLLTTLMILFIIMIIEIDSFGFFRLTLGNSNIPNNFILTTNLTVIIIIINPLIHNTINRDCILLSLLLMLLSIINIITICTKVIIINYLTSPSTSKIGHHNMLLERSKIVCWCVILIWLDICFLLFMSLVLCIAIDIVVTWWWW